MKAINALILSQTIMKPEVAPILQQESQEERHHRYLLKENFRNGLADGMERPWSDSRIGLRLAIGFLLPALILIVLSLTQACSSTKTCADEECKKTEVYRPSHADIRGY